MIVPSLGVRISVRGVVDSLPSHSPPKIGGTHVLKLEIIIDCYLVFRTLVMCNSSLYDFLVDTVSPVTNFR